MAIIHKEYIAMFLAIIKSSFFGGKILILGDPKKGWVGVCGLQLIQRSFVFEKMAQSWHKLEISKKYSTFPV